MSSPKELQLAHAGAAERQRRAWRQMLELAWLTAALSRTKRLPRLETLLAEPVKPGTVKKQSWQEMKALMHAMTDGVIPNAPKPRRR